MNKQKGLSIDDIVAIASEDYRCLTLSVGIQGCEQYTVTKEYSDKQDYLNNVENDINEYQKSHARTVFIVDDANDSPVVNDSWGAIWKDAEAGIRSKIFAR